MVMQLCFGVTVLAVVAAAAVVANADILVECLKDSVNITWTITPDVVPARLFLGNCMASQFSVLPTGERVATFNYKLDDCKFKREVIPEGFIPPFLSPGSGAIEGHGRLVFHMALLNADLKGIATTNIIPLGSFIPIWAAVEQASHQPLLLLLEECVAAATPELQPDSQVYPIITNKGCLLDGKKANSVFLPRYHSSAITLLLQSFKFSLRKKVYIHCKLVVWDPEVLTESKKACNYVKETGSWELLDDPAQSHLCSCCDSTCSSRYKREAGSGPTTCQSARPPQSKVGVV
ncbi:zona pellucida sperm-binding protein 3-like [Diretmus argenteus]